MPPLPPPPGPVKLLLSPPLLPLQVIRPLLVIMPDEARMTIPPAPPPYPFATPSMALAVILPVPEFTIDVFASTVTAPPPLPPMPATPPAPAPPAAAQG